jgi:hypothetical protein
MGWEYLGSITVATCYYVIRFKWIIFSSFFPADMATNR